MNCSRLALVLTLCLLLCSEVAAQRGRFPGRDRLQRGGRCPPVRTGCPPVTFRFEPVRCSSDSECLTGRKCCFDACVQTEVCKATV